MDINLMQSFSDFGVAGVLMFIVYYLLKYIKTKDDIIQELLNVNQEQNLAIKDVNNYMKQLADNQRECAVFAKYGYWWINVHQPSIEICNSCDDYQTCFHPRKIVLKNRPAAVQPPPEIPR